MDHHILSPITAFYCFSWHILQGLQDYSSGLHQYQYIQLRKMWQVEHRYRNNNDGEATINHQGSSVSPAKISE
jgi:hypothetical protein